MSELTFCKTLNNVSSIIFNNEIAGKLAFDNDNKIITLDIEGWYYHAIKDVLLDAILSHFSTNHIALKTLPKYQDYYEEFGFEVEKNIDDKCIKMTYKK